MKEKEPLNFTNVLKASGERLTLFFFFLILKIWRTLGKLNTRQHPASQ